MLRREMLREMLRAHPCRGRTAGESSSGRDGGEGDEKEKLGRWETINTLYVSFRSKRDREFNAFGRTNLLTLLGHKRCN